MFTRGTNDTHDNGLGVGCLHFNKYWGFVPKQFEVDSTLRQGSGPFEGHDREYLIQMKKLNVVEKNWSVLDSKTSVSRIFTIEKGNIF